MKKQNYLTFEKVMILVKIYHAPNVRHLDYSKLSHLIGVSQTNTIFSDIMNILKEENILKEIEIIGTSKMIEFNKPLLKEFIGETYVVKEIHEKIFRGLYNSTIFTEFTGGFKHE